MILELSAASIKPTRWAFSTDLRGGWIAHSVLQIGVDAATAGAALAAAWEHLTTGVPAGWTRRVPGALGAVTGAAVPTLNGVWVYGPEAQRDAVGRLLDHVSDAGMPHCLQLSVGVSELRALATARGMRRNADVPLMVLVGAIEGPSLDHGDLVIEVLDPEQAAVHAQVAAAGFQAPVETFLQLTTPAVLGRPGVRTYLGSIAGRPIATGFSVSLESHVGIFNVATLPAHRRRGYGAAITARAVSEARSLGAQWAWLQSSPDGYGIYERLGFRTVESWECWITDLAHNHE